MTMIAMVAVMSSDAQALSKVDQRKLTAPDSQLVARY